MNDILRSCLCIIVTATSVDAEPIGVKLPPRLAPKITDHHIPESPEIPIELRMFDSTAANGMLSVTLLAKAEETKSSHPPRFGPIPIIGAMPLPIRSRTLACSIAYIATKR